MVAAGTGVRADAHIHLFTGLRHELDDHRSDLARYSSARAAAGIRNALVVAYEGEARFRGNSDAIADAAQAHPWIHPLAWIPDGSASDAAASRRRDEFAGLSLYLTDERSRRMSEAATLRRPLRGRILSVNAEPRALRDAAPLLLRVDEGPVLISHLGLPGPGAVDVDTAASTLEPLLALAAAPHVFVKLSGLYAIERSFPHSSAEAAFRVVLDAFGPDRIVWGSDFPPVLDAIPEQHLFDVPPWAASLLRPTELDSVLGGTLTRLLVESGRRPSTDDTTQEPT
ncbi:amidohydrolase family protein [Microbacterium sp. 179-I 3D3 NHS]|uniref:amidohydrolase family protein n=1 Tax=unclassified Microbacterium TaxID=2609290 RepID=UPI0039A20C40